MTTSGGSATSSSSAATTRSSTILRLLFTLLIGLTTQLLIPRATAIAAADEDRGGSEDGIALELTSPDLYTRFSGGAGDSGGGLRLQQAGSSLVIDGNALTVASSEPNATTWWLVELAPRDGLFAIQAVLVTQGDRGADGGGSGDSSDDSAGDGIGSLRVLVGNDTRLQPSLAGGAWTECAPPGGDRSLRAQLFLCCSGAAPVFGRAVAVYASSDDGRVRPLNLNEVTVLGAPRQCPPGLFGLLCERRCGRCARGPAATASGSSAACECSVRGCYEASADATGRRRQLISECWLASSTPLVASAAAAAMGRLELISNRPRPPSAPRPPADRCAGRERRRSTKIDDGSGVEEYVAIRHAAFDLSAAAVESMTAAVASSSSVEAWLLVGNDSRSPPYAGSPRWAKCGTSRVKIAPRLTTSTAADGGESFVGAGRRRTSVVLSCDTPVVGKYAVALLRRATRAIAYDDDEPYAGQQQQQQQLDDEELVDAVGYAVLPAEQLLGFAVYVTTATAAMTTATNGEGDAAASAVDLSFLGYYWMNERRYATYMMLAFPALFAIVMMAATFAIACIKRKKVVAENAYYSATAAGDEGDDLPPLLQRRTAGGSASELKLEREADE